MTISPAYADLGGAVDTPTPRRHVRESQTIDRNPGRVCDRHMFDPMSGWCGCGLRDDGQLAPGSPAWRAKIERTMPEPTPTTPAAPNALRPAESIHTVDTLPSPQTLAGAGL